MSPTLLELFVAALVVVVAWRIGLLIAPRIIAAVWSFWRESRPTVRPDDGRRPEKNITPPPAPGNVSSSTHGHPGR